MDPIRAHLDAVRARAAAVAALGNPLLGMTRVERSAADVSALLAALDAVLGLCDEGDRLPLFDVYGLVDTNDIRAALAAALGIEEI